jgi:hypothetical protein
MGKSKYTIPADKVAEMTAARLKSESEKHETTKEVLEDGSTRVTETHSVSKTYETENESVQEEPPIATPEHKYAEGWEEDLAELTMGGKGLAALLAYRAAQDKVVMENCRKHGVFNDGVPQE